MINSLVIHTCKNCNNEFNENFCNKCGQKEAHRITMSHVMHDVVHVLLHADKGIFPFMARVMVQPGIIAKEYLEGKRKIFNPYQYLILVVGLVLFLMTLLNFYEDLDKNNQEVASKISSVFLQAMVDFNQFIKKYSNIISFLCMPIYAIFSWLMVRKKQLNYAEHLTMIVVAMAFGYTYNVLVLLGLIIFKINTLGVASISLVLYLISFCITYKQCFDYKWPAALLKGTLVFLCSYITQVIILGIGLVIYFIILKSKS